MAGRLNFGHHADSPKKIQPRRAARSSNLITRQNPQSQIPNPKSLGSLVHRKGLRHIFLFGRFQKTYQILGGSVFVMMAGVACVGLHIQTACFQSGLGEHKSESVTMGVPGLADARHLGHVAADTAAKGVDPVDRAVLWCRVAGLAKLVFKQPGLGTDNDQRVGHLSHGLQGTSTSVNVVAGDAGHTYFGMFAFLPIEILLVAVSGFPARPK
jgi:hypothetical protein